MQKYLEKEIKNKIEKIKRDLQMAYADLVLVPGKTEEEKIIRLTGEARTLVYGIWFHTLSELEADLQRYKELKDG
jgi:hypothetical protein